VAVVGEAGNDADMRVGHFIAECEEIDGMGADRLLRRQAGFAGGFKIRAEGRDIVHPAVMRFRNKERVAGIEGVNVEKPEEIGVLIHLV
jgi:hypothetical protein